MLKKYIHFILLIFVFSPLIITKSYTQSPAITLGWDPNTEPELSHYIMYRDTMPGTMIYLDLIPKPHTTYIDLNLIVDQTYYYKLTAVDSTGNESSSSNEVMGTAGTISLQDDNESSLANKFELKQNYPNPFNPTTTIEYNVPIRSQLKITIYDLLGKEVRTLVDDYREAATYEVRWDGKDNYGRSASSGVYFYQMIGVDSREVRKSIFQK